MSLNFVAANNTDSIEALGRPITGYPYTIAGWFRCGVPGTGNQLVVGMADNTSDTERIEVIQAGSSVGDPFNYTVQDGGTARTASGDTPVANKWTFFYAVGRRSDRRDCAIDFGPEGGSSVSVAVPATLNVVYIGRVLRLTQGSSFGGQIAHIQIWNRALSKEELRQASLFPGSVKNGLVYYNPCWFSQPPATELDYSGSGLNGTITAATLSPLEPPVQRGRRFVSYFPTRYGSQFPQRFGVGSSHHFRSESTFLTNLSVQKRRKLLAILGVG